MSDEREKGPTELATEAALDAASHLDEPFYVGAKAALLALARKIDAWDTIALLAAEWAEDNKRPRPTVPAHDNVSAGSYFRALAELGLTPMSQAKLERLGENLNRRAPAPKAEAAPVTTPTETLTDDDDDRSPGKPSKLATVSSLRSRV
jgi:hypothetical protein